MASRIIPAHAGNSTSPPSALSGLSDHPARMRGTQIPYQVERHVDRIIPAHAGNSRRRRSKT